MRRKDKTLGQKKFAMSFTKEVFQGLTSDFQYHLQNNLQVSASSCGAAGLEKGRGSPVCNVLLDISLAWLPGFSKFKI